MIALAVGCALGGQEGEDYQPSGTSPWSSSTDTTGTPTGTTSDADGNEDADAVPGLVDTGDTGDTGMVDACGAPPTAIFLSPDDSNSYASAALARLRSAQGGAIGSVRPYELFNYYDFDVPPGPPGSVSLTAEWLEDGLGPEDRALQIQVGGEVRELAGRAPLNLTFVLDTSGSMSGAPIERTRDACEAIAARLLAGDVVSMVTWDTSNNVVLDGHAVSGPSDPVLLGACDALAAGGGTDLGSGLDAGYRLADDHWATGMTSRVILVSDGGANVGVTDEALIAERAWRADGREVFLVGIGVGDAGYNDLLMDTVTDAGRGAAVFLDSRDEAFDVLHDRFLEVFEVAVTDVRLELELPERLRIVRSSAEQVSTDPDAVRPQYLAPNAEMVLYAELDTPAPGCLDDDLEIVARARFVDRQGVEQVVAGTFRLGDLRQGPHANALKGRAIHLYAEALRATSIGGTDLVEAIGRATAALDAAEAARPGDPDLAEMRTVLTRL